MLQSANHRLLLRPEKPGHDLSPLALSLSKLPSLSSPFPSFSCPRKNKDNFSLACLFVWLLLVFCFVLFSKWCRGFAGSQRLLESEKSFRKLSLSLHRKQTGAAPCYLGGAGVRVPRSDGSGSGPRCRYGGGIVSPGVSGDFPGVSSGRAQLLVPCATPNKGP